MTRTAGKRIELGLIGLRSPKRHPTGGGYTVIPSNHLLSSLGINMAEYHSSHKLQTDFSHFKGDNGLLTKPSLFPGLGHFPKMAVVGKPVLLRLDKSEKESTTI